MNNEAMGLDTFIERELDVNGKKKHYITLEDVNGIEKRITLVRPIVRQRAIVCRGTTCFVAKYDSEIMANSVVKFSWTSDKRRPEVEHLRLALERGVQGVVKVVAYRQITTIAELRAGLDLKHRHRFRNENVYLDRGTVRSGSLLTTTSSSALSDRRRSTSDRRSSASHRTKRRHRSQNSRLSAIEAQPSLYTSGSDLWDNRIFSCIVISPVGRVLSDFRKTKELLEAIRDAIKAHRSLYISGNILHRDISMNNIIITDPAKAEGFKGMLIDLDLAKERDSGPSGARQQTGTMQFMAVEVLEGIDHTYRHDLESFFYVLFWMCAREAWSNGITSQEQPFVRDRLWRWDSGDFADIALNKGFDTTFNGLRSLMNQFPTILVVVKPLCFKIRDILFPHNEDQCPVFGTPAGDPDQLYKPILAAYDDAIRHLLD